MSKSQKFLTSLSELNELNQEVWLSMESNKKISQGLSKLELGGSSPPCEDAAIANAAATDAPDFPMWPNDEFTDTLPDSKAQTLPSLPDDS